MSCGQARFSACIASFLGRFVEFTPLVLRKKEETYSCTTREAMFYNLLWQCPRLSMWNGIITGAVMAFCWWIKHLLDCRYTKRGKGAWILVISHELDIGALSKIVLCAEDDTHAHVKDAIITIKKTFQMEKKTCEPGILISVWVCGAVRVILLIKVIWRHVLLTIPRPDFHIGGPAFTKSLHKFPKNCMQEIKQRTWQKTFDG